MLEPSSSCIDIDPETAELVQVLSTDPLQTESVTTLLTIENLRRLEDEARCAGTSRQAFQRIMSARRLLGDRTQYGPTKDLTYRPDTIEYLE